MAAQLESGANKSTKLIGWLVVAAIGVSLLLMVSDYRVLVGEEQPAPFEPDMTGPSEIIQGGDPQIDYRRLPPFGRVMTCRYFTGRSVTTVTFNISEIDSCPLIYKPKAYDNL